jgi:hypothetical protein
MGAFMLPSMKIDKRILTGSWKMVLFALFPGGNGFTPTPASLSMVNGELNGIPQPEYLLDAASTPGFLRGWSDIFSPVSHSIVSWGVCKSLPMFTPSF